MSRCGECTFRQLPVEYRELFANGADRIGDGVFVAEKHPASVLLGLPILWLFAFLPAILVHDGGLSFGGVWGLLSWIPPLAVAGLTCVRLREAATLFRSHRAGARTYGLVIDEQNVVSRQFRLLPGKSCVFIPRTQIVSLNFQKSVGNPSKYGRSSALWIQFVDDQGKKRSLKLAEGKSHELRPERLKHLFLAQNKRIRGEWRLGDPKFERSTATVLCFDESEGRLSELKEEKVFSESTFTYRQTGYREIVIESLTEESTSYWPVETGRYEYEIEVDSHSREKRYVLRFERELGGNRGRWFGPVVDGSWELEGESQPEQFPDRQSR